MAFKNLDGLTNNVTSTLLITTTLGTHIQMNLVSDIQMITVLVIFYYRNNFTFIFLAHAKLSASVSAVLVIFYCRNYWIFNVFQLTPNFPRLYLPLLPTRIRIQFCRRRRFASRLIFFHHQLHHHQLNAYSIIRKWKKEKGKKN